MNTDTPQPLLSTPPNLDFVLESILLTSDKPLSVKELHTFFPALEEQALCAAVEKLKLKYNENDSGIVLYEVANGLHLRTNPQNNEWILKYKKAKPVRLSRATLETLSIIAYRQPITRPEIDEIRGVDSGYILQTLLERNLIKILGKREAPGNPLIYGTTPDFLSFFHIANLSALPTLREYTELGEESLKKLEAMLPPKTVVETLGEETPLPEGSGFAENTDTDSEFSASDKEEE